MKNTKFHCSDTATPAFQPIVNMTKTNFSNLSSLAISHWIELDDYSPDQWGAFMHFYGQTRSLLKYHGLDLEEKDFTKIQTTNEKWNYLLDLYKSHKLSCGQRFYFIRLLFYLGFYESGIQICQSFSQQHLDLREKSWEIYLKCLGESILYPLDWKPCGLENLMTDSSLLNFHIFLLLSRFYIRRQKSREQAEFWLNKAESTLCSMDGQNVNLGIFRLSKYKADCLSSFNDNSSKYLRVKLIEDIELYISQTVCSNAYLANETKRRVLDSLIMQYINDRQFEEAFKYSLDAIAIDPYCSYALAIAGDLSIKTGKPEIAYSFFEKSALFGVIERSYAKHKMSEITSCMQEKKLFEAEAMEGNLSNVREKEIPLRIQQIKEKAGFASDETLWGKTKQSPSYQRLLPFWELKASTSESPLFCNVPLIALDVYKQKSDPWYQTLYAQRAVPGKFREELFFSASPNLSFSKYFLSKATSIDIFLGSSEVTNWLIDEIQSIKDKNILEKTLFSRLLGALGFYREALNVLPIIDKNRKWGLEIEYAFCTRLFLENIYYGTTRQFNHEDIDFAFQKISNNSETLRMKLVLSMLGTVCNGQRQNIIAVGLWRERGIKVLGDILNNQYISEFEKQILTSRFYRASSYYSFLTKDYETLRYEAELCESFARKLTPKNEKEEFLKKENLFPMLESMSRIYFQMGEHEHSLELMKEIVYVIDPYDAKAWLQVGDLSEKLGLLDEAKKSYQKACDLEVPLGGISWFRLGRFFEKTFEKEKARVCYLRSLKLCPKGISPLKRLIELSIDPYILFWCEQNLSQLSEV